MKFGGGIIGDLIFLFKLKSPFSFYVKYCISVMGRPFLYKKHKKRKAHYKRWAATFGTFTTDWFTKRIPYWIELIESNELEKKSDLTMLEIGSYEGLSTCFFLQFMPLAQIYCVDTWEGSDEHKTASHSDHYNLKNIEKRFDDNTASHSHRVKKIKCRSVDFFRENSGRFDLIYIDGSHFSDDVISDAIAAFRILKDNGYIIFDDYFFKFYPNLYDNVASAVNAFFYLKNKQLVVERVYSQIIFKKIQIDSVKE